MLVEQTSLVRQADRAAALEARRAVFIERMRESAEAYLASDPPDARAFRQALSVEVKGLFISSFMAGHGGDWLAVGPQKWGQMGPVLRNQYRHARQFARELAGLSEAQIVARIKLYAGAASQAYQRGLAWGRGLNPEILPALPGDGSTDCRSNCLCSWRITTRSKALGDFDVSWVLGRTERHCRTCPERARQWRRLKIRGGIFEEAPAATVR